MIDLHLHLDGSLSPADVLWLAREQKIKLPSDSEEGILPYLTVPSDCADLNEYLRCFSLPLQLLQTADALKYAARSLVLRLAAQGIIYAEIRFAPQLHLLQGMTQRGAVSAVLEGVNSAVGNGDIKIGVILCCMRMADNAGQNTQTVDVAADFLDRGVCAVDLAGAEALYPTRSFADVFGLAREKGVPITIHAGEADGADSVRTAIALGARRIGHGVRAADDDGLLHEMIARRIAFEMCPKSNLQTKAVGDIGGHPVLRLLDMGALVTVNTDNMTVSGTTIDAEFKLLRERLGMTHEQHTQLLLNSAEAAFLPANEREMLAEKIRECQPKRQI